MENDFVRVEVDETWILPADEVPPAIIAPPPSEVPRLPERQRRILPAEPTVGPWFMLAMGAFALLGLLSTIAISGGMTGMAAPVAIAVAFGAIYVGFFLIGSFWFEGHRRR
jgi:hypothetical protein